MLKLSDAPALITGKLPIGYRADRIDRDFEPVILQALVYSANRQTTMIQIPTNRQKYLNGEMLDDHAVIQFEKKYRTPGRE